MEKNPLEINFTNFWGFQKSDNSLLDEFFEAVISSDIQKVKGILDVGKDIVNLEKEGWTALTIASWNGDKEMVKLLIENGADISKKNKYGKTALMLALEGGHKEVVELLKSYETKTKKMICPNCKAETDGLIKTPYGKFCSNCKDDIPDEKDIRGNYNDGDEYFEENIDF